MICVSKLNSSNALHETLKGKKYELKVLLIDAIFYLLLEIDTNLGISKFFAKIQKSFDCSIKY